MLTLVGSLLELAVVGGLLDKVQKALSQALVGQGPGWIIVSVWKFFSYGLGAFLPAEVSAMVIDGEDQIRRRTEDVVRDFKEAGSRKGSLPRCRSRCWREGEGRKR